MGIKQPYEDMSSDLKKKVRYKNLTFFLNFFMSKVYKCIIANQKQIYSTYNQKLHG